MHTSIRTYKPGEHTARNADTGKQRGSDANREQTQTRRQTGADRHRQTSRQTGREINRQTQAK